MFLLLCEVIFLFADRTLACFECASSANHWTDEQLAKIEDKIIQRQEKNMYDNDAKVYLNGIAYF